VTAATPTPDWKNMEVSTWTSTSPDGEWLAEGTGAFPKRGGGSYYTQLKVSRVGGAVEWIVVDAWPRWGLGYTIPKPFHWSQDGQSLYYTNEPVPDGCAVFVNGSDLWRVGLANGSLIQIVPSVGLWLSLSPDETTLAYIGYGSRGLVLRDLNTGAEREVSLDPGQEYSAGQITWSPDGAALVLTLAIRPCFQNWAESTSIVRVETENLEKTTLVESDSRLFTILEWPAAERVLLADVDGQRWWMDALTGHLWRAGALDPAGRPVARWPRWRGGPTHRSFRRGPFAAGSAERGRWAGIVPGRLTCRRQFRYLAH
jgi:hypothetical protein